MDEALNVGSDEGNSPAISPVSQGIWTISPSLPWDARLAGVPKVALTVNSTLPNANLSVDVYDIDANRSALLLSRTAYLLPAGASKISPEMYGNDWLIPAGHRIGVLVTTANAEWWTPTPSMSTVALVKGSITLPFLRRLRTADLTGYKRPARLDQWLQAAPLTLSQSTIDSSTSNTFRLPPRQRG